MLESHSFTFSDPGQSGAPGGHAKEERQVQRWLLGGFLLMIVLLLADVVIGFSTIISIRESVSDLAESQFRNVALIDEVQRAQSSLGSVLYQISFGRKGMEPAQLRVAVSNVESTFQRLFDRVPPTDPDIEIWRDVERTASALTLETNGILTLPHGQEPDLGKLLEAREQMVSATLRLIRANHSRAEAISHQIDAVAAYQFWEDGALLVGCLIVACVGAWLILRTTTRLFGQITEQNAELTRVSWQLLEKQENLARRLSHELHDELGQSLTALKTNFSRHASFRCADPAWMNDCSSLLKESIRSAHEISLLLRPTMLDDFGLDSALGWLCERFEERNGIKVRYVSDSPPRMGPETETHLFRIAQEALTNVVRHSGSTEVIVTLHYQNGNMRLRIADNGVGLPTTQDSTRPHLGLTGMRARARTLRGEMAVRTGSGQGTEIDVVFPWNGNEHKEENPNLVGR